MFNPYPFKENTKIELTLEPTHTGRKGNITVYFDKTEAKELIEILQKFLDGESLDGY